LSLEIKGLHSRERARSIRLRVISDDEFWDMYYKNARKGNSLLLHNIHWLIMNGMNAIRIILFYGQ
jgi:hypothetical protein